MKIQFIFIAILLSITGASAQWATTFPALRTNVDPIISKTSPFLQLESNSDNAGGIAWGTESSGSFNFESCLRYNRMLTEWHFTNGSGIVVAIDPDNPTPDSIIYGALRVGQLGVKSMNFDDNEIQCWDQDGPNVFRLQRFGGGVKINQEGSEMEVANKGGVLNIGTSDGKNMALDNNDIQAYNDLGEASILYLNFYGGALNLNDDLIRTDASARSVKITGIIGPQATLDVLGNGNFTGELTAASDARLKKNVAGIKDASATLAALNPVSYEFKTAQYPDMVLSERLRYGLIAQEVEQVLPELVSENMEVKISDDETDTYKSVNYIDIIGILIKANQEQQQEIATLKAERNSFEARLVRLEQALTN